MKHPDAPATPRQIAVIRQMADERGLAPPWPPMRDEDPTATLTRGEADRWIQDTRAQGGRACKRVKHPDEPPSEAQMNFIDDLIREGKIDGRDVPENLNRGEAGRLIEGRR